MAQDFQSPPGAGMPQRRSNTTWIIIAIIVVLLLCCCGIIAGLWFFGDQILLWLNSNTIFIVNWLF